MSVILTCNAGSTNTKLAAYDSVSLTRTDKAQVETAAQAAEWIARFSTRGIAAIGHRVVHGGRDLVQPVRVDDTIVEKLESYITLAPLHQPASLELLDAARRDYPDVVHVACFDTAFHATMPAMERRLPLPRACHEDGIQRYGFHGLSYQHVAEALPRYSGRGHGRVVAAHLGGGASACAMRGGKSIASTMGFSTLDGLMMSTRSGALDPGVILHLLTQKRMSVREVEHLLYKQSGLVGVSGISADMRDLAASTAPEAQEAIDLYVHLAARQIGGLLPALGGLDVLVFTGGIGENNADIRECITQALRFAGDFEVHVIPADEEGVIARACRNALNIAADTVTHPAVD